MEVLPDEGAEDGAPEQFLDSAEPAISLHALSGVQSKATQTMKIPVWVGSTRLMALLDSGSTHNFIADDAVQRTGILLQPQDSIRVAVANGDHVSSNGVCRGLQLRIDQRLYTLDCFSIPLVGFDIVLGVQWLSTLGPILWDFQQMTLTFRHNDQTITWRGLSVPSASIHALSTPSAEVMTTMLEEFGALFAC